GKTGKEGVDRLGGHRLDDVVAGKRERLQPEPVDHRRTRMLHRPPDDAGKGVWHACCFLQRADTCPWACDVVDSFEAGCALFWIVFKQMAGRLLHSDPPRRALGPPIVPSPTPVGPSEAAAASPRCQQPLSSLV